MNASSMSLLVAKCWTGAAAVNMQKIVVFYSSFPLYACSSPSVLLWHLCNIGRVPHPVCNAAKSVLTMLTCAGILHCMFSILCSQLSEISVVGHMPSSHQCVTCKRQSSCLLSHRSVACTACCFDGLRVRYMFPRMH